MRADHIRVFLKAALEFGCEIVVRQQNPLSEKYIGMRGYKPKPIWCHAKTADNTTGPEKLRGLVVNPTLVPSAFGANKLKRAVKAWKGFERSFLNQRLGFALDTDTKSLHYGCLLFHGDYLYSDYDLKSVTPFFGTNPILKDRHGRAGVAPIEMKHHPSAPKDYTSELERKLMKFFKDRTGIALIQHGAEKNDPESDVSSELCDVFLPCAPFHVKEIRTG